MKNVLIKTRKGAKEIKWQDYHYLFCETLEIFSTDLEEIKAPNDFPTDKLKSLFINCPNLKKLPNFIGSCSELEVLKIKNNENLKLENHDYNFPKLKTIQLSGLALGEIPNWLSISTTLETVDLSFNHISEIPEFFGDLKNIRRINFEHNKINKAPLVLKKIDKLNHLSINHNPFSEEEADLIFKHFNIEVSSD